jgi:hypothetical protein
MKSKDFFGKGMFDSPIYVYKWIINRHFPFIHKVAIQINITKSQRIMNKKWLNILDLYNSLRLKK